MKKTIINLLKLIYIIILILMLNVNILYADYGKSGWMIFKKVQGTRLKNNSSIYPTGNNLSGVFYNPATLGIIRQGSIFFVSELGFIEDKYGALLYSKPLKKGTLASGVAYYDAGMIDLNWIENDEIKTQNVSAQKDLLWILSYGYDLKENLYFGLSIKIAKSELFQRKTAVAYAGDLGIIFKPAKNILFSAAFQNFGDSTKFNEAKNQLPTSLYLGSGYSYQNKEKNYYVFSGIGGTYNLVDEKIQKEAGIEIGYEKISVNLGYNFDVKESNLHLGLILKINEIEIGYAYVPGKYLLDSHRITLGIKI